MNLSIGVVPVESDANVTRSSPICTALVMRLKDSFEVECMLFSNVFDTKVVHDKCKSNGSCYVRPETGHILRLEVASLIQSFFK